MRAGRLARWAWRPAGVAAFGVVVVLGGVSMSHAGEDANDADIPRWVSEETGNEDPDGDDTEQPGPGEDDSGGVEDPEGPKWEGEDPEHVVIPLGPKWE